MLTLNIRKQYGGDGNANAMWNSRSEFNEHNNNKTLILNLIGIGYMNLHFYSSE
uniref:Uncharacterized protein n=1 Tax=Rhizophora mucronata TaxID=61149 RepID=A0A2P2Q7Q1_RHIMU